MLRDIHKYYLLIQTNKKEPPCKMATDILSRGTIKEYIFFKYITKLYESKL